MRASLVAVTRFYCTIDQTPNDLSKYLMIFVSERLKLTVQLFLMVQGVHCVRSLVGNDSFTVKELYTFRKYIMFHMSKVSVNKDGLKYLFAHIKVN